MPSFFPNVARYNEDFYFPVLQVVNERGIEAREQIKGMVAQLYGERGFSNERLSANNQISAVISDYHAKGHKLAADMLGQVDSEYKRENGLSTMQLLSQRVERVNFCC